MKHPVVSHEIFKYLAFLFIAPIFVQFGITYSSGGAEHGLVIVNLFSQSLFNSSFSWIYQKKKNEEPCCGGARLALCLLALRQARLADSSVPGFKGELIPGRNCGVTKSYYWGRFRDQYVFMLHAHVCASYVSAVSLGCQAKAVVRQRALNSK